MYLVILGLGRLNQILINLISRCNIQPEGQRNGLELNLQFPNVSHVGIKSTTLKQNHVFLFLITFLKFFLEVFPENNCAKNQ